MKKARILAGSSLLNMYLTGQYGRSIFLVANQKIITNLRGQKNEYRCSNIGLRRQYR